MSKNCDVLIVGQGISGSLLYYHLTKAGLDCLVLDDVRPNTASRVAAGLINPVTGRRLVKSWMIEELLKELLITYREIEVEFNIQCLQEKELTWFFPATDVLQSFEKRLLEGTEYLAEASTLSLESIFNFPFKAGNIKPVYVLNLQEMLDAFSSRLLQEEKLIQEKFDHHELSFSDPMVKYKGITSKRLIFCEGSSAVNNPFFNLLPYSLNKGEALILQIKDLARDAIYKFKQTLVPLADSPDKWWYGSDYEWEFENDLPTSKYLDKSNKELKNWLKLPYSIIDHKAAVRYATVERRPFIGFHPLQPEVGIFNGWGTKGCSLVPYFAREFAHNIVHGKPLLPEVDIKKYNKLLSER